MPGLTGPLHALLVSSAEVGEADALVRFFSLEEGALTVKARGLRKTTSKLAHRLKPADELKLSLAGRGATPILTGVEVAAGHPHWRDNLDMLALWWFMAECAYCGSGTPEINAKVYQLAVNLLRAEPSPEDRYGAAAVFCLKYMVLQGLLADLSHCALDGHLLSDDEPAHLLPSGEGLVGREQYNSRYAKSGALLFRLDPQRLRRWRRLRSSPLLEYAVAGTDGDDAATVIRLTADALADIGGKQVKSAEFLVRQWRLPALDEIIARQRT